MSGVRDTSSLKAFKSVRYRDPANSSRLVKAIRFRDQTNTLQTMFGLGGLTVSASPSSVVGYGYSASPIRITTGTTAVTVSGGSGSYSIAWTLSVGSGWTAINPSSFSTAFRSPLIGAGLDDFAEFTGTITDTVTGTTALVTVEAAASNTSL